MRDLPTGTVTFLFTDIEGSTRLLQELGPDEYAAVLTEHRRVVRDAFGVQGGVEVDTQGDAFFYVFSEPSAAAAGALSAQDVLAGGPVRVRMGLHTGVPTRTGEGYVGEDVHLGARVAAAAHGGQVLLSRATRDLLDDDGLLDLGEHRLKDFDRPIWIYQLGTGSFPPLKTISNTNLPRPASSFVGREKEVAEVRALLRHSRLVTLTGPGGSGKTRMSIEAASEEVGEFKHGVYWIGLATIRDPALVVPEIAKVIGAQDGLAEHVGVRELLLLLDNLEQVVDVAPELALLVEGCPNLRLLITSRERLRVRGEIEYEVLPLAGADAVELFCARAQRADDGAVEELCRRLDNMPLALELAAARAKALAPDQLLERLSQRLDLLKGGRDAEPRQATLRATIEWSYDLLDPAERQLFARLAVFGGGCTLDAAEAICQTDLDTLQSLVEKSLVRRTDARFWMLETIREFALERLEEVDEPELRRRHFDWFLSLGERSGFAHEREEVERYDLVLPEVPNIRDALEWALAADPLAAALLVLALEQFWVASGPFEGRRWLAEILAYPQLPDELRAKALRCYGGLLWIVGDFEEGNHFHEQSLALFRRLGDRRGEALVLIRSAVEAQRIGDLERARALCAESLEYFRSLGSAKGEAEALLILSYVPVKEGRFEEAFELADRAAVLAREVGWRWWESGALGTAAECALSLGRTDEGQERAVRALAINRAIGSRQWLLFSLAVLAWAAAQTGDAERSGRLWGAIEAEAERGRIGQWEEGERDEYADHLLPVAGPEFDRGVAAGRATPLADTVEYALSVDSPS